MRYKITRITVHGTEQYRVVIINEQNVLILDTIRWSKEGANTELLRHGIVIS